MKKLLKNKKGFTLIEIIVVIVILAVLMAVAVPSVLKYVNEADDAKYMTDARAVMNTAQIEVAKASIDADGLYGTDLTNLSGANGKVATESGVTVNVTNFYVGNVTVVKNGTKDFTVTSDLELTAGDKNVDITAVKMIITEGNESKVVVASLNDKIYVAEDAQ